MGNILLHAAPKIILVDRRAIAKRARALHGGENCSLRNDGVGARGGAACRPIPAGCAASSRSWRQSMTSPPSARRGRPRVPKPSEPRGREPQVKIYWSYCS
ncbi:hypothetical protein GGD83_004092 [Rhodoblastus sphagnicola]|nr:hypothetical protein [Rhodoblastus sphagnicola]